jgi:hypothetical protein
MPKIIKSNYKFLVPVIISILSFWVWRILNGSLIVGILVILSVTALYVKKIYLSYFLLFLIAVLVFRQGFDRTVFVTNGLENSKIQKEEVFLANGFGKLYRNRIGIFLYKTVSPPVFKLEKNLFYNLDPNQYFFAGHPRERADALEFEKFSAFLLPFFLIGIYLIIKRPVTSVIFFVVISVVLSSFISGSYALGPVMLCPVLIYFISSGFEQSLLWLRNIFY